MPVQNKIRKAGGYMTPAQTSPNQNNIKSRIGKAFSSYVGSHLFNSGQQTINSNKGQFQL